MLVWFICPPLLPYSVTEPLLPLKKNKGGGGITWEKSAGVREAVGREGLSIPNGLGSLPVMTRVGANSSPLGFLDLER